MVLPPTRPWEPSDPERTVNYGRALGLALGAVLLYLLFFEHVNDSVRLPDDFQKIPEIRPLGSIPRVKSLKPGDAAARLMDASNAFGDSLRVIRTNRAARRGGTGLALCAKWSFGPRSRNGARGRRNGEPRRQAAA